MRISSLPQLPAGARELGVVYASVEGVNERSYDECLEHLVHSQFQWNQRTSLLATAISEGQGA